MSLSAALPLQSAPSLHDRSSTTRFMWIVVLTLLPAGAWGCWMYGLRALLIIGIAVASALIGEIIAGIVTGRRSLSVGSAVLAGLLVAYLLPPGVPFYLPVVASLFAVLVMKAAFGGLGSNWLNPAVAGQLFVYLLWPGLLERFRAPMLWQHAGREGASVVTTPLPFVLHRAAGSHAALSGLIASYPTSGAARAVAAWSARHLGIVVDPHFLDLAVGAVPGDIGAVSPLLLVLGSIYLFRRRIITWHAPVAFLASLLLVVWIAGGLPVHRGWFTGMPLLYLLSGSTILVALFLATDPVTSPLSSLGMVIFGVGLGIVSFLVGLLGIPEEAVLIAVLVMNLAVPALNRLARRQRRVPIF